MAAEGYPGDIRTGDAIEGLGHEADGAKVFHAGTKLVDGQVVTSGGRVLCATGLGESVHAAQQAAYAEIAKIQWPGETHRLDIGYRAVARETTESRS